jgi:prepilin-type N-terminal cleavage/methylation domain-containing protein
MAVGETMNQETPTSQGAGAAGFSLLEVMISVVLLAVAMLAIGAAQLRSLQFSAESSNRSQAMYLAEEQMDAFMAMPSNDGQLAQLGDIRDPIYPIVLADVAAVANNDAGVGSQTPFYRSWSIVPGPGAGMRTITVQVRWNIDPNDPIDATSNLRMVQLQGVR